MCDMAMMMIAFITSNALFSYPYCTVDLLKSSWIRGLGMYEIREMGVDMPWLSLTCIPMIMSTSSP